MKAAEERERVAESRKAHHKALESLATIKVDGLKVWRKLRELERDANAVATARCNGQAYLGRECLTDEQWETYCKSIEYAVGKLFGIVPAGFFVNGDPRGYALKIESDTLPAGLHRDWGNYGILAPEIN